MEYTIHEKDSGEETHLSLVIPHAYRNIKELQVRSYSETSKSILEGVVENDRVEVVARKDNVTTAVAVIVIDSDDIHVGECVIVQWNYSIHTDIGFALRVMRVVKALSEHHDIPYAYTKRTGEGQYSLKYKRYTNHG